MIDLRHAILSDRNHTQDCRLASLSCNLDKENFRTPWFRAVVARDGGREKMENKGAPGNF